jgi:5-methylcytosine-specific restriction endonuclease McrA
MEGSVANEELTYEPVSRKEAMERGHKHYFGKPCKKQGHGNRRYTKSCHCVACELQWGNSYRGRNREHVKAVARSRYAKNPDKATAIARRKYKVSAESIRARRRRYHHRVYADEKVRIAAQHRTRQWVIDNPAKAKRASKVSKHRRRAIERKARGSFTASDVADIFTKQRGRCALCRTKFGDDYHVDHIVALVNGGANDRRNIQLLCQACNLAKGARDPTDHARSLGFLL